MDGRYFEQLNVGDSIESAGRTITEQDIMQFAALSGDDNPIHVDPEFAKTAIFGQQIAHGLLGLAIASGLALQTGLVRGTAEAFTACDWKFRAPIFIGDAVRIQAQVTRKKAMRRLGGGLVVLEVTMLNQRDQVVQKGTWTALVRSQEKLA
ncbi:MAG: MaoC family dehydratase N-terminal domain-containing protein [Anaerolineae bacterium]|nr:MaoC family dehydratase N-terminal domain-containing protein [Anaerolineae bacterium]